MKNRIILILIIALGISLRLLWIEIKAPDPKGLRTEAEVLQVEVEKIQGQRDNLLREHKRLRKYFE